MTELMRPAFRCPVTAYIHAEQPMSYSQHMCLEFPSRNPPSPPSEKSRAQFQQDSRVLVHVSSEKTQTWFQTGGHIYSRCPTSLSKMGGFFPPRWGATVTENFDDKRQHVYQNTKFHLQQPLNLQMHFCH